MGCDIHTMVDIWENGQWVLCKGHYSPFTDEAGYPRDYNTFSFLANIRNEVGCPYISEPRGLTEERKEETKEESYHGHSNYYDSYHSHSWITLKELLEYDYKKLFKDERTRKCVLYISDSDEIALKEKGRDPIMFPRDGYYEYYFYRKHNCFIKSPPDSEPYYWGNRESKILNLDDYKNICNVANLKRLLNGVLQQSSDICMKRIEADTDIPLSRNFHFGEQKRLPNIIKELANEIQSFHACTHKTDTLSLKDFLGNRYFEELDKIKHEYKDYSPENIRIFMYFDS